MNPGVFRQRLARLLVVVCAVAIAPAIAPAPAAAASVSHKYLHFNMCGNKCNDGGLTVADDVINSVNNSSPQPFAVTLNEVCRGQWNRMYYALGPYYGRFEVTVPGACDNGDDYGIGVLVKTSSYTFVGAWQLPGGYEPRKLACIKTSATGGGTQPLVACVTHIDYHSDVQAAQIKFVADRGREQWSGNHVMIGGDFNVTPADSKLSPMYTPAHSPAGSGIFNEADTNGLSRTGGDAGSSTNEHTGKCIGTPCGFNGGWYSWLPQDKIDFIFLSRYDFSGYSADATFASRSDHTPLWAWATYV